MTAGRRTLTIAVSWAPVLAYSALIWWISSQSLSLHLIDRVPMRDKGVHFIEYAALGLLMAHAARVTWPAQRLRYVASWWLTFGIGLGDELHQVYVPGRSGDSADLVADAAGAALGTLLYTAYAWFRRKRAPRADRDPA